MDKEKKCTKHFPKDFNEMTSLTDGYPLYRRLPGPHAVVRRRLHGPTPIYKDFVIDNRHVVPYNKFLTLKYNAHINVEVCTSVSAVKYIYKYIYKGYDCAQVEIKKQENSNQINYNEIEQFIDARYVSAIEAMWRLLKYKMHDRSHGIVHLAIHLPQEQRVYFKKGQEVQAVEEVKNTTLTAYFELNRHHQEARQYSYHEIPYHYVYKQGKWKKREKDSKIVPRIVFSKSKIYG